MTERSVYVSISAMPMVSPAWPKTADAVVVGGGTVGAWCAYFLREAGLGQVVLIEKDTLGQGASSRAAGVVRTQGGTTWAVRLGEWSRTFYLDQRERLGIDSGFTPHGYVLPCFTEDYGNAASRNHAFGWKAEALVENARTQIGALIGGDGKGDSDHEHERRPARRRGQARGPTRP